MTSQTSNVPGAAWDATLLALRSEVSALRFTLALRHAGELARFDAKYSPDQPRVPAGSSDGGQWTDGGGGESFDDDDNSVRVAQATGGRGGGRVRISPTAPVETQLLFFRPLAAERLEQVRTIDPTWAAPQSVTRRNASPEAELAHLQATVLAAEARLAELGRPVANPMPGGRTGIGGNSGPPLEPATGAAGTGAVPPGPPVFNAPNRTILDTIGDKFELPTQGLPEFLQPRPGPGSLVGTPEALAKMSNTERDFADELGALGNQVEVVDTGKDPTPDFKINGVSHELKTVTNIVKTDAESLSGSISTTIVNARGQSPNIIIDARGQAGMTKEAAEQAVKRAYGADFKKSIDSITILTPDGPFYAPRIN